MSPRAGALGTLPWHRSTSGLYCGSRWGPCVCSRLVCLLQSGASLAVADPGRVDGTCWGASHFWGMASSVLGLGAFPAPLPPSAGEPAHVSQGAGLGPGGGQPCPKGAGCGRAWPRLRALPSALEHLRLDFTSEAALPQSHRFPSPSPPLPFSRSHMAFGVQGHRLAHQGPQGPGRGPSAALGVALLFPALGHRPGSAARHRTEAERAQIKAPEQSV